MKAIYIEETGGPDVLKYGDMPKPELVPGHALVKVEASGVNFIDTYHRSGLYKLPLPAVLGSEGAGIVEVGNAIQERRPRRVGHVARALMRNTLWCRSRT